LTNSVSARPSRRHGIRGTAELGEARVGECDAVAVDRHGLVHRFEQAAHDRLALAAGARRLAHAREQVVDACGHLAGAALARVGYESRRKIAGARERSDALTELAYLLQLAVAAIEQHGQQYAECT
jgi:hypothetical protein